MNKIMVIIEKRKKEHTTVEEYHGHIFVDGKKELTTVYTDLVQLKSILEWEINSVFNYNETQHIEEYTLNHRLLAHNIMHIVEFYFKDITVYVLEDFEYVKFTCVQGNKVTKLIVDNKFLNVDTLETLIQKCLLIGGTVK